MGKMRLLLMRSLWYIAPITLLIVFGIVVWILQKNYASDACSTWLTEWISATGTWFAISAALAGALLLLRQINDASHQDHENATRHNQLLELQLHTPRSRAQNICRLSKRSIEHYTAMKQMLETGGNVTPSTVMPVLLDPTFSDNAWQQFREAHSGSVSYLWAVYKDVNDLQNKLNEGSDGEEGVKSRLIGAIDALIDGLDQYYCAASEYLVLSDKVLKHETE